MANTPYTWVPIDAFIGLQPIAVTSTTQQHPAGKIIKAKTTNQTVQQAGEFIYLLGVASTAIGSVVTYNEVTGATTLVVAGALGPVAVAISANVAAQWGWYQIGGPAAALASAIADCGKIYIDTITGRVDDAFVTLNRIENAKARGATDSTTITSVSIAGIVGIQRPYANKYKDS